MNQSDAGAGAGIELRLAGAPEAVSDLRNMPLIRAAAAGEGVWAQFSTGYFETPDGGYSPGDHMAPAVSIVTDRWSAPLKLGATQMQLVIDLGRAEATTAQGVQKPVPLTCARLQLISGDAKDLFDLARALMAGPNLRLGGLSMEASARRLLAPPGVGKLARFDIAPDDTSGEVMRKAYILCAERMAELTPMIVEARDPETLRQMRVVLRRFRALERLFRKVSDDASTRDLNRRARVFANLFGEARDWDVFLSDTMDEVSANANGAAAFHLIAGRAHHFKADAWAKASELAASKDFSGFVFDVLETAHLQKWRERNDGAHHAHIKDFAAKALDKRRRNVQKIAAALADQPPAARHELRIALKKLRYAAQTFRPLYAKDQRKPYMAAMSRLQDGFGALNDAVVARGLADRAADGQGPQALRAAGFIAGYSAAKADAAAARLAADWRNFEAMAPFWRV